MSTLANPPGPQTVTEAEVAAWKAAVCALYAATHRLPHGEEPEAQIGMEYGKWVARVMTGSALDEDGDTATAPTQQGAMFMLFEQLQRDAWKIAIRMRVARDAAEEYLRKVT